jgi:hypothetical protein
LILSGIGLFPKVLSFMCTPTRVCFNKLLWQSKMGRFFAALSKGFLHFLHTIKKGKWSRLSPNAGDFDMLRFAFLRSSYAFDSRPATSPRTSNEREPLHRSCDVT